MTTSTRGPARWRDAAMLLIAVLIMSGAALYNGYPMVYPDTGAYLRVHNIGDRSVFYSLFLAPARLTHTLWSVVFAQCLLTAYLLRLVLREVFAIGSRLEFLAIIAVLCMTTSLPWYAGFLMPDIFTPLMVLGLFMLAFCFDRLSRWEQCFVVSLTFVAAIVHYSHIPIAIGLLAIGILARWVQNRYSRAAIPHLALPAAVVVAGIVALVMSNYLMLGIATYSPGGYAFELARLVQNGPAVEYLRESCPTRHYAACAFLDRMPMSSSKFLWSENNLFSKGGFIGQRKEGLEIVTGTIEEYPLWVFRDAIADTFRQLLHCLTGAGLRSWATNYNPSVPLRSLYPEEFASYVNSKQNRGQLEHMRGIQYLDASFLLFSVFYCVSIGILLACRRQWLPVELIITVGVAILLNAFVTGAISEPINRYGSRVIWLIPLIGIALWRKAVGPPEAADAIQPPRARPSPAPLGPRQSKPSDGCKKRPA
jgi:hypothetical protein